MQCRLRKAEINDGQALVDAFARSAEALAPWAYAPLDIKQYIEGQQVYLLINQAEALVGVFTLSGIIRGLFHSAYLGYNCFSPFQGQGYMGQGLHMLMEEAFGVLNLHRLEANIQPGNKRSIALVERCGFQREGYSPQYLRIGGLWCDHERWAILNPHWRAE
jgi:[ribosomal protein S5]-alanine N-acetyltransferase